MSIDQYGLSEGLTRGGAGLNDYARIRQDEEDRKRRAATEESYLGLAQDRQADARGAVQRDFAGKSEEERRDTRRIYLARAEAKCKVGGKRHLSFRGVATKASPCANGLADGNRPSSL